MRGRIEPLGDGFKTSPAVTKAEKKYKLIGVQGDGTGCCYLIDEDRKGVSIALPMSRLKNIGTKTHPCHCLFLKSDELIKFAEELVEIYNEWILELKEYKKADTESMLKAAIREQRIKEETEINEINSI